MSATTIINQSSPHMFFVTPEGITVMGRTRVYETYDRMLEDPTPPKFAWVIDATGDTTVSEGAAFYAYKDGRWRKLYESEAMDNENLNKPDGYDELVDTVSLLKATVITLQSSKLDKVPGKGLSTNDFSDTYKQWIDSFEHYDDTQIKDMILSEVANRTNALLTKVDKEVGKGLSSNDFTDQDKEKLDSIEPYDDTQIKELIDRKEQSLKQSIATKASTADLLAFRNRLGAVEQEVLGASETLSSIEELVGQ